MIVSYPKFLTPDAAAAFRWTRKNTVAFTIHSILKGRKWTQTPTTPDISDEALVIDYRYFPQAKVIGIYIWCTQRVYEAIEKWIDDLESIGYRINP